MLLTILSKAVGIIFIIFLVLCIVGLFKVFELLEKLETERGYIAIGILAEVLLICVREEDKRCARL